MRVKETKDNIHAKEGGKSMKETKDNVHEREGGKGMKETEDSVHEREGGRGRPWRSLTLLCPLFLSFKALSFNVQRKSDQTSRGKLGYQVPLN